MVKLGEVLLRKAKRENKAVGKAIVKLLIKDLEARTKEYGEIRDPKQAEQYFYKNLQPVLEQLYNVIPDFAKEKLYWDVEVPLRAKFEMRLPKRKVFS